MIRGIKRLLISLLLIVGLTACAPGTELPSGSADGTPPTPTSGTSPVSPAERPVLAPVSSPDPAEAWLAAMSTQEKVGQLLVAGIEGLIPGEDGRAALEDYYVGGIILFGRNVESPAQLTALTNDLKALNRGPVPLFLSVDEEGGRVSRMPEGVMGLLSPYEEAKQGGDSYTRGAALGAQCAAFGFNLNYAPVLDVWSNPKNTVIGDRAFGSTWAGVTAAGPACAQGLMDAGVVPVVKHFPGHGDTLADSHKTLPVVEKGLEQLMGEELLPFIAAIEQDVPAVMVAHILMTQLDSKYPASLSSAVVDGLLRETLGFDGMVCTDDLTMGAISNTYSVGEAAVLAVEAGCDLLLVCHKAENLKAAYDALWAAVDSGRISTRRLDESVGRILRVKAAYGLQDGAVDLPDIELLNEEVRALLALP